MTEPCVFSMLTAIRARSYVKRVCLSRTDSAASDVSLLLSRIAWPDLRSFPYSACSRASRGPPSAVRQVASKLCRGNQPI